MSLSPVNKLRKLAGQFVFNRLIFPTNTTLDSLVPFAGDYGHGLYYEELFSGPGDDLSFASKWCADHPGAILDLAGGAGRLALRLSREGHQVSLVDRSTTMLAQLRAKWAHLDQSSQNRLQICPVDMESMELDSSFETVFSLNNAMEHPETELNILATLRSVYRHLNSSGHFFIDVHHLEYLEREWHFRRGIWHYTQDQKIDGIRYRVWSRTYDDPNGTHTVCEHAISHNLNQFTLLKTSIRFLAPEHWIKLFEVAGYKVQSVWGDWKKSPVSPTLPKLVFHLRKRDGAA